MIQFVVVLGLIRIIAAVRCTYCGQNFVSLGRHVWRCKARVTSVNYPLSISATPPSATTAHGIPQMGIPLMLPPTAKDGVVCVCGRACKGRRGLTAHHRSCEFFKRLIRIVVSYRIRLAVSSPLLALKRTRIPIMHQHV